MSSLFSSEVSANEHEQSPEHLSTDQLAPPQRVCLVCGEVAWRWNGNVYQCGSGNALHGEEARFQESFAAKVQEYYRNRGNRSTE
jgi:hypothetical protein